MYYPNSEFAEEYKQQYEAGFQDMLITTDELDDWREMTLKKNIKEDDDFLLISQPVW